MKRESDPGSRTLSIIPRLTHNTDMMRGRSRAQGFPSPARSLYLSSDEFDLGRTTSEAALIFSGVNSSSNGR